MLLNGSTRIFFEEFEKFGGFEEFEGFGGFEEFERFERFEEFEEFEGFERFGEFEIYNKTLKNTSYVLRFSSGLICKAVVF